MSKYLIYCALIRILINSLNARNIHVSKDVNIHSVKLLMEQALSGDTVFLHEGHYYIESIVIRNSIAIIGIGNPILDGQNKNEILIISGSKISISGITVQNSGRSGMNDVAGIKVIDASEIWITNNTLINCHFGIHVSNSTSIKIQENVIMGFPEVEQNTGNGIHLWKCQYANIFKNIVTGHRDGIYFEFVTNSTIQDNKSYENIRYGLHFMFSHNNLYLCNEFKNNGAGVAVMYSKNVRMEQNTFLKNWGSAAYGLLLNDITDSDIKLNHFIENTVGIHFEGTSRVNVVRNIFERNGWAAKVTASCMDNIFYCNNFIANSFDVATNGSVSLNQFEYNYWDKYDGYDLDHNKIGDIPYYPVTLYSLIVEQNPNTMILLRSILLGFLDKAEKAIPSLTPENLKDSTPSMTMNKL